MLRPIIRSNRAASHFDAQRDVSRGDAGAAADEPYTVTAMLRVNSHDLENIVERCLSDAHCVGVRVQRVDRGSTAAAHIEAPQTSMAPAGLQHQPADAPRELFCVARRL